MKKFTSKIGEIEENKFTDRTKNKIYSMIKENLSIAESDDDTYIRGIEDLTNTIYEYIQKEKIKQEILTLEKVKITAATGTLNFKQINESIQNLNDLI